MKVTRTIGINGHKEFFVISRYYDGSASQDGPFACGVQAAAEIARQEREDREMDDAAAEADAQRGPEFPRGEFPF